MTNKKWKLLTYTSLMLMMASPVSSTVLALENTDADNLVSGEKQDNKETTHNTTTDENKSNTKKEVTPTTKQESIVKENSIDPFRTVPSYNGKEGQKIADKGVSRAKSEQGDELDEQLSGNDWSILRTLKFNPGAQTATSGNSFNTYIAFGKVYIGVLNAARDKVLGKVLIYDSKAEDLPTADELNNMTVDERFDYRVMTFTPSESNLYLKNQNDFNMDIYLRGNRTAANIFDGVTPGYSDGGTELKILNLGLSSSTGEPEIGRVSDLSYENFEKAADQNWGNINTSYMTWHYYGGDATKLTKSVVVNVKNSNNTFYVGNDNDSRISNPSELLNDQMIIGKDSSGNDVTAPISDATVSWHTKPDTSKAGTGSAIIKIHYDSLSNQGAKGDTYLRVPYVVKDIQPVTVKYVDESGNSIYADQTIDPTAEGDPYDASTSQYKLDTLTGTDGKNYHLDTTKLPDNATGVFGEQPITVTYTYKANQTAMTVHNSELYVGDAWKSQDNWDSTLDMDGKSVDFAEVQKNGKIEGDVDTTKAGTYKVKYSYQDAEATATIVVKDNQSTMKVHDSTIYVGDSWLPKDNWDSATYQDGSAVDFSNIVTDKLVDTTKAGVYKVNYSIKSNPIGLTDLTALATATATITVKDNLTAIDGSDVTKYVGDAMPADSEFKASATDKDGNAASLTIDKSKVDMTKPGDYDVVLSSDNGMTKTVQVHVLANQQSIKGSDVTKYIGDTMPEDSEFKASATDKDGKNIAVTLDKSRVDMNTVGDYDVVITATDGQTKTVQVHVLADQRSIKGTDVTKHVGDKLPADSEFKASAVDIDGNVVSVKIDKSKVDMTKAGDYDVVITADDGQKLTVQVHVLPDLRTIKGSDVTKYVGDAMPTDSEFKASATDVDGNNEAVTLDKSKVDMTRAGDYDVKITAPDGQAKTVQVHVLADKRTIKGSDVTKHIGDTMPEDSEFKASATDKDGNDIVVTLDKSQVDMNTTGDYDVVITATDGQKLTVQVHVLPDLRSIDGSDVNKYVGDELPTDVEFKASATDIDGKSESITFDKSQVDMSQVGDYDVTLTAKDGQTKTVQVHVRASKVIPETATVIVKYLDEEGNTISKNDILLGQPGEKYTTKAKDITGYLLTGEPKNKDGVFVKGTTVVEYRYEKEPTKPTKPTDPKDNTDKKTHPANAKNKKQTLPQTGEAVLLSSVVTVAGVTMLLFATYLILGGKKKSNE